VQKVAEAAGYSVVREYVGHAIGPRCTRVAGAELLAGTPGPTLKEGMVFAIEPMVKRRLRDLRAGRRLGVMTQDGKLSAHFEHTIG